MSLPCSDKHISAVAVEKLKAFLLACQEVNIRKQANVAQSNEKLPDNLDIDSAEHVFFPLTSSQPSHHPTLPKSIFIDKVCD